MIYFDNAATTLMKPPEVAQAVTRAIGSFGSPGRAAHEATVTAGLAVLDARRKVAKLFGASDPKLVAFCSNATEALNTAILGMLSPGDHAITTAASHNSVLRPLYRLRDERSCGLSIVSIARDASIDLDEYERAFTPKTRLVVLTHASNLTGDIYDVEAMARIAHAHGAPVVLDVAQTAGHVPIDMEGLHVDAIAFTGHKGLFGPQGTGGLVLAPGVEVAPLKVGGTGMRSFDHAQPDTYPERLEAGTLNAHGIAGLAAGIDFVTRVGIDAIRERVAELTDQFRQGVSSIEGVRVYGGHGGAGNCGVVALNVGDAPSSQVADVLDENFGICVRAGAHCAPLMHEAMGTQDQGIVRFSFSYFNTPDEIGAGIDAVAQVAEALGARSSGMSSGGAAVIDSTASSPTSGPVIAVGAEDRPQIDRSHAQAAFDAYVADYDPADPKIDLKIVHTRHVAELCDRIARSLDAPGRTVDLAWLCGLLHDIGRFEQVRRYGTFDDATTQSHAAMSEAILFGDQSADARDGQGGDTQQGIFGRFVEPGTLEESELTAVRTAIATHSDFRLPEGLDPFTRTLCDVLRDADKIDILRANIDTPTSAIQNLPEQTIRQSPLSPAVEKAFYDHRTVLRSERSTPADALASYACFVLELVYPESRRIAAEQGYVFQMLDRPLDNPDTRAKFDAMSAHLRDWLSRSIGPADPSDS